MRSNNSKAQGYVFISKTISEQVPYSNVHYYVYVKLKKTNKKTILISLSIFYI